MPDYTLQVGAAAFWDHAARDIAGARRRVLVQAMTFEGDAAGEALAEALIASKATERRVLVDDYTRHVINDTFLAKSRDASLHAEATATWRMFDRLAAAGVGVRITNPIEGRPLRYPLRNHKKLLVIDDAVWLGGVNFSDHNFAWHDMMVRIADPTVADWLTERFADDWRGDAGSAACSFPDGLELVSVDGIDNPAGFAPLLSRFAGARRSIEMLSPYPTFPFIDALGRAAAAGAQVTLHTPWPNNKPIVRDYILRAARRYGISVRLLPEMSHAKCALIDGETLVMGSTNFDFVSFRTSAEFIATITDPGLVAEVEARLFAPARTAAMQAPPASARRGFVANVSLRVADALIARLRVRPEAIDWSC